VFRAHWWAAVAAVTRQVGDLEVAEDAVQDACAAALAQWPVEGVPASPRGWLIGTARHKALDRLRRERRRADKEAEAMREEWGGVAGSGLAMGRGGGAGLAGPAPVSATGWAAGTDDELALIFTCCHPALDPAAGVGLTLRCVCGLATAEIAAAFLVPEPTMAQRLVRAKRKIRQAGIAFRVPAREDLPARLSAVLRVVYLVFTEGHLAAGGDTLIRGDLCDMSEGPAAGLVILDTVGGDTRLARWPQLHIARAELLRRLGRRAEAVAAYEAAIALEPPAPERAYLARRMHEW